MNREEILNELLKKVMVVVEANEYVLASGVRDWNVPCEGKSLAGETYPSDYYRYHKKGLSLNSLKDFGWRSYRDKVRIAQNKETGEYDIEFYVYNPSKVLKGAALDGGNIIGGEERLDKKAICKSDLIFYGLIGMLNSLLNIFKYKYDNIVSGKAFISKMTESKVASHIDTYMKKIADVIQNNGKLTGYFGPLDQADNIIIGLQKSIDSSEYSAPVLTFETSKMAVVHSDKDSIFKFIYPESIINYEAKTDENSPVLNDLRKMGLQDMLCEFTSGLNENATFEDVVNTIFWRSRRPFVNDELAREINSRLGGRGLVYPETQIQNAPSHEEPKTM